MEEPARTLGQVPPQMIGRAFVTAPSLCLSAQKSYIAVNAYRFVTSVTPLSLQIGILCMPESQIGDEAVITRKVR